MIRSDVVKGAEWITACKSAKTALLRNHCRLPREKTMLTRTVAFWLLIIDSQKALAGRMLLESLLVCLNDRLLIQRSYGLLDLKA